MNPRFLPALVLGLWTTHCLAADGPAKPNLILIVADDLGWGELGCQGFTKDIPTPNIDALAKAGVRFTNGYVSCPVCSPTRAGLLTGKYQQRFGHEFNPGPQNTANEKFGLPRVQITLAERLKSAGYKTGMVGKWHLGFREGLRPPQRGFEEFFGFLGGGHSYVTDRGRGQRNILRGSTQVQETEYLTDAFRREAVAFIDRYKGESFFLYVPFNAVHAPMQGAENYLKRFDLIKENKRRTFAAMLAALDDAVGAIRSKVSECGLEEKTLIAFISDNGGPTAQTSSNNGPLRGFKGQVFEGGVRVPFMIAWPGKLPGGQTYEQPVIALDVHPTFLSAAGIAIPPEEKLDGVNLLPFLLGEKSGSPHQRLFWRFGAQKAVRQGDWKLIVGEGPAAGRRAVSGEMLFDLSKDLGEKTNLAQQKPEKLKELRMVLAEWEKELVAPKWRRGQGESD